MLYKHLLFSQLWAEKRVHLPACLGWATEKE